MMNKYLYIAILTLISNFSFAITNDKVKDLLDEANDLLTDLREPEDADRAFTLIKEANKIEKRKDANKLFALYYASKSDVNKTRKYLKKGLKIDPKDTELSSIYAKTFIANKQFKEAEDYYTQAIEQNPKSGQLHYELGSLLLNQAKTDEDTGRAIELFRKGLEADPNYAQNYKALAIIFSTSKEPYISMIMGETFINLEKTTPDALKMGMLVYELYNEGLQFDKEKGVKVAFAGNEILNDVPLDKQKLSAGNIYEIMTIRALAKSQIEAINLETLNILRNNFTEDYIAGSPLKEPLFEYMAKVKKAGHMDAYNHLIFMEATPETNKWIGENQEEWDNFVVWYKNNPFVLDSPTELKK